MITTEDVALALVRWLEHHDHNIVRFMRPVPLTEVSHEVGLPVEQLAAVIVQRYPPVCHTWEHEYQRGRKSRSKPYCLRLSGPNTVCLDWEDSIVGAVEAEFQGHSYQTRRQLESPEHLAQLIREPSLAPLAPGENLRDFWALRRSGQNIDLWIVEAKGKEAYGFDFYCLAETLGQVFPVSAEPLIAMLGSKRGAGHGICWSTAQRLFAAWTDQGFRPTITVGALVPEWSPDVVWDGGKLRSIDTCFYARPLADFRHFCAHGTIPNGPRPKYRQAFGQMLSELDATVHLRSVAAASIGLRFRLLTTTGESAPTFFRLSGVTI